MPKFTYKAKNPNGQDVTGIVEADSKKIAVSLLRDRGYIVYSLDSQTSGFNIDISAFKGVSATEKVNFTRNLASMIGAGLPLSSALEVLLEQVSSTKMKEVVQTLIKDVQSGTSLSDSMIKFPKVYDSRYTSLVKAGEASGKLDEVLKRLAESLEKQREFSGKVKSAMIYPAIIMMAMAGVFTIIVVFVIPKLVDMYQSFNIELPLPTKIMIAISNFTLSYWYIVILGMIASIIGFRKYIKTASGKYVFAHFVFKIPVFGIILKEKDITEFSRTLALLSASGVSIVDALTIARDSVTSVIYKDAISDFTNEVRKGNPLSGAIENNTAFPVIVAKMIKVGEETGTTDETLNNLSNYFEGEVDRKVKNLTTALEPLIMLVLGGMVGVLIISVITPIYKLTSQF